MITINGRFLTQRVTGSQGYAHEVVGRLLHARGAEGLQIFTPLDKGAVPREFSPANQRVGRLKGHIWEQLELGRRVDKNGGILWSPKLASAATHLITVSRYSKKRIVETLKVHEEKVSVIYPGIDARFSIAG